MDKDKCWWLKRDCRKCLSYPDCPGVETRSGKPRGCSCYREVKDGSKID